MTVRVEQATSPTAEGRVLIGELDAELLRHYPPEQRHGLALLRLETGTEQKAAIGFYRRAGFAPCAAFAPYSAMPAANIATSIFMEKEFLSG